MERGEMSWPQLPESWRDVRRDRPLAAVLNTLLDSCQDAGPEETKRVGENLADASLRS